MRIINKKNILQIIITYSKKLNIKLRTFRYRKINIK